jgi:SAM-dependent methyltransferase
MNKSRFTFRALFALYLAGFLAAGFSPAIGAEGQFQPEVGQEGKDVVWVPTPEETMEKMLDLAKLTPKDFLIDLGSGDGRTVIAAAKRGAHAHGVEYNSDMVELSKRNAAKAGVSDRTTFAQGDLFEADLSKADVITLFLLSSINLKLRPKLLDLRPGTRIASNTFDMGEWEADATATAPGCDNWCTALLWVVPAKVEGTWRVPQGELVLKQSFQVFSGTLKTGNTILPVKGKLQGDQITFTAGKNQYSGRVSGNVMEGAMKPGGNWKATRVS